MRKLVAWTALGLAGLSAAATAQGPGARPTVITGEMRPGGALTGSPDRYMFDGRAGQRVTLTLDSEAFDPHLFVTGPGGFAQDNDDSNETLNSRLELTLPRDGRYEVVAGSFSRTTGGGYRLGATGAALTREPAGALPPAAPLTVGQQAAGRLAPTSTRGDNGGALDRWALRATPGQHLMIRLVSTEFDPYLIVHGTGVDDANDDEEGGEGLNSGLEATVPADGMLMIGATGFSSTAAGAYTISATPAEAARPSSGEEGDKPPADEADAAPSRPLSNGGPIAVGQTLNGELRGGDATSATGQFVDTYTLQGRRGDRVSIRLSSRAFDTILRLHTPAGDDEENDDATEGGMPRPLDSRLDYLLHENGAFQIMVTSYGTGGAGRYTLAVQRGVAPPPPPFPANRKVFAVLVGVSDYPDAANHLPDTDQDAIQLRAALAGNMALDPASVVLTNAGATRAAMAAALARVAQQAGPDDLVVFFFSGHGSQRETTPSAAELDGMQERIVLYDGNVSDFELQQMLQPIRAKMLVVLDSCNSGGFGNVVSRPGIMAVFSSEEDLTSEVAGPLHAGGYISYYAREGLGGAADGNGDGVITAGELAQYLRVNFYRNRPIDATTDDGIHNFQHPVILRGGMRVDEPLIRVRAGH